jgi:hypothetical protein
MKAKGREGRPVLAAVFWEEGGFGGFGRGGFVAARRFIPQHRLLTVSVIVREGSRVSMFYFHHRSFSPGHVISRKV